MTARCWEVTRRFGALAVIALVLAVAAPLASGKAASAAATSPPPTLAGLQLHSGNGLTLVSASQLDSRLLQLTFTTAALAGPTNVRVLLPEGFDPSGATRYPVLYLLHGGVGDYTNWTVDGDAEAITAPYKVIVVMPDGGPDGLYANWYNFGNGGPPAWETYHLDQLLPWVDANLPTVANRAGRAIAGLSMGGAGSTHYAARHPDLFSAVASFSGAVDVDNPLGLLWFTTELSGPIANAEEGGPRFPTAIYGPWSTQQIRWRGDNAWDLADNLRGLRVFLATGNGLPDLAPADLSYGCVYPDPVEMAIHHQNVQLHQRLSQLGIPHVWDAYGAGCHSFAYWQRDLRTWMPLLMAGFADPTPAPSPFTYRSADATYSVYGWTVAMHRPAMEWSQLENASSHGFTLTGSGTATVTTAAAYQPGAQVPVSVVDQAGSHAETLTADAGGHLTVPVDLGPANPYQQDTLVALLTGGTKVREATVTIGS